jgi:hypothetical protein
LPIHKAGTFFARVDAQVGAMNVGFTVWLTEMLLLLTVLLMAYLNSWVGVAVVILVMIFLPVALLIALKVTHRLPPIFIGGGGSYESSDTSQFGSGTDSYATIDEQFRKMEERRQRELDDEAWDRVRPKP